MPGRLHRNYLDLQKAPFLYSSRSFPPIEGVSPSVHFLPRRRRRLIAHDFYSSGFTPCFVRNSYAVSIVHEARAGSLNFETSRPSSRIVLAKVSLSKIAPRRPTDRLRVKRGVSSPRRNQRESMSGKDAGAPRGG